MVEEGPFGGASVTFTDGQVTRIGSRPESDPDPAAVGPVHWTGAVAGRVHVKVAGGWFVGDGFHPEGRSTGVLHRET